MAEYKLPEPSVIDTHIPTGYKIRGYTADTLRSEIAAAEKRGAEQREAELMVIGMEPFGYYDPSNCLFSFPGFYSNEEELIAKKIIDPLYTAEQLAAARLQGAAVNQGLLEAALLYVATEGHAAPLHTLPKGVTLFDNDGVQVKLPDGRIAHAGRVPKYLVERAAIAAAEQEKTK